MDLFTRGVIAGVIIGIVATVLVRWAIDMMRLSDEVQKLRREAARRKMQYEEKQRRKGNG